MTQPTKADQPVPSRSGAGQIVTGILAGIDHLITNRPRAVSQIEEEYRDVWASTDGVTVATLLAASGGLLRAGIESEVN